MSKYVIPRIDEPIMTPNGTMSLPWYLYLKQGGTGGGGGGGGDSTDNYIPPMLSYQRSDHKLNDMQWLRADTFSWQNGAVYFGAYQHLLDDWNEVGDNPETEIIEGIQIWYRLAPDGHKICSASQERKVAAIYNKTGDAWYFIIDTTNERFKLPRTKKPETNFIPDFANQQAVTMPFTAPSDGWFIAHAANVTTTVYVNNISVAQGNWATNVWSGNLNCQIIVKKGDIVTGAAGTMRFIPFVEADYNNKDENKYLYFYVGAFEEEAIKNTAGLNAEMFNDLNAHKVIAFQAPTAANNYTWYRKYADGWVEQGGQATTNSGNPKQITLPLEMADIYYNINITPQTLTDGYANAGWNVMAINTTASPKTNTNFYAQPSITGYNLPFYWQVSGMAAN